jgi:very-short-patch-repair endonuclease
VEAGGQQSGIDDAGPALEPAWELVGGGVQDDLGELLTRQHGVISRRQALRFHTARVIERRVSSGRWQAPHRGVFVTHSGPIIRQQRRWVAALGLGRAALLGGLSALETLNFCAFQVEAIHMLVPASATIRHPPAGVLVHRTSRLTPGEVHRLGDPPGTMPARSILDAAQWAATDGRPRAIIAAAVQQRLVDSGDLTSALAQMPRLRRRALIAETVADAAAGAHSLPEAAFLRMCRRARLPTPSLQHVRRDHDGRRRYLDAYFAEWGLHVEIDGGQHTDVRQWWADMARQNALWIPGNRVLRFPSWAIRHRPNEVLAQLHAALLAAGWSPGRRSPRVQIWRPTTPDLVPPTTGNGGNKHKIAG